MANDENQNGSSEDNDRRRKNGKKDQGQQSEPKKP